MCQTIREFSHFQGKLLGPQLYLIGFFLSREYITCRKSAVKTELIQFLMVSDVSLNWQYIGSAPRRVGGPQTRLRQAGVQCEK